MQRHKDIDIAKGIAIILVVFGHVVSSKTPPDHTWYEISKTAIYQFHMPFFMFLSGYVFRLNYGRYNSIESYLQQCGRKIGRIFPAFFIFATLIFLSKLVASKYVHVDNFTSSEITAYLKIFIFPASSAASSLWFIYTILCIYLVFPLLFRISGENSFILTTFSLFLYFVPAPFIFSLYLTFTYLFFFSVGFLLSEHKDFYLPLLDKYRYIFLGLFLASFSLQLMSFSPEVTKLAIGTCSLPAIHSISRYLSEIKFSLLNLIGQRSFSIYLMNTLAIGALKAAFLIFVPWEGKWFYVMVPSLTIFGLVAPVFIKELALNKFSYLKKITD